MKTLPVKVRINERTFEKNRVRRFNNEEINLKAESKAKESPIIGYLNTKIF